MLDYLAYLVLVLAWIFGGAAVFDDGQGYKLTLKRWSAFTAIIGIISLGVLLVVWSFLRVTGAVT